MLKVKDVSMVFGGLVALDKVNIQMEKGEIRGIIGPNGSGKTTLINVISGFYVPTSGQVTLYDKVISGKPPNAIVKCGLCRTFQNINLFAGMSALENVVTACCTHMKSHMGSAIFRSKLYQEEEKQAYEKAREILDFVGLSEKQDVLACNLPYGQQRRLEIARALATDPQLLLLDEPVAGMNEQESDEIARLVQKLRENGKSILLIEHHMKFVMAICDYLSVLNTGALLAEGDPASIQNNEDVVSVYLGKRRRK